jgi:hypothetical protein
MTTRSRLKLGSVSGDTRSVGWIRRNDAVKGALATLIFAGVGVLIAAWTSYEGCGAGAGDGTFDPTASNTSRSGVCHLMHFPGFPDSLGSLLLVGAVYLSPAIIVVTGWVLTARQQREDPLEVSIFLAVVACLALVVLRCFASVQYLGAG